MRLELRLKSILIYLVGATQLLTNCGRSDVDNAAERSQSVAKVTVAPAPTATSNEAAVVYVSGSRARTYNSLDEVAEESDLIVLGSLSAEPGKVEQLGGVDFSIQPFNIEQVFLANDSPGDSASTQIDLRVLGSSEMISNDVAQLRQGTKYLLFLARFSLGGKDSWNGQYVVVGADSGGFTESGVGSYAKIGLLDPQLPTSISIDEVRVVVQKLAG